MYGLCPLLASRFGITDLICHLDSFLLLQGFLRLLKGRLASFHSENPIYIATAQGCKCWSLEGNMGEKEEKEQERATKLF